MNHKNIHIIGTSHIARQSMQDVKKFIEQEKPDIIALELDRKRFHALLRGNTKLHMSAITRVGINGFLFGIIGAWASKKVGKLVGVMPGSEMRTAIYLAKKNKVQIALIDQDIELTLKRFSQEITLKEKLRFVWDIIKSIFSQKKEMEKLGIKNIDLTKVPEKKLIRKLIKRLKQDYPSIYKVLIDERNQVMANNLRNMAYHHPDKKILAVVGAGHEEDITKLLKAEDISYEFKVNVAS